MTLPVFLRQKWLHLGTDNIRYENRKEKNHDSTRVGSDGSAGMVIPPVSMPTSSSVPLRKKEWDDSSSSTTTGESSWEGIWIVIDWEVPATKHRRHTLTLWYTLILITKRSTPELRLPSAEVQVSVILAGGNLRPGSCRNVPRYL